MQYLCGFPIFTRAGSRFSFYRYSKNYTDREKITQLWNGISHGHAHFHTKKEASAGAVTETSFQGRETHMKHGVYLKDSISIKVGKVLGIKNDHPVRLLRSMGWSSFMERQVIYLYFTTFIKVGKTRLPYYAYAAEVSTVANQSTSSLTGCGSSHSHLVACASVPLLSREDGRR